MTSRPMGSRMVLVIVIVIIVILFCLGWMKGEYAAKHTWEYKYVAIGASQTPQVETMLNQQGADGWELIQVDREQPGSQLYFYFKRAK